jgi:LysM repeat protein
LVDLSVAEPAPKPEPAPAPARSAKRAASAHAAGRVAAACAPAPVPAVVLPPDDTLAPKDGFEIHTMTAEDKTLSNLARSRGITLAELLAANPQIADPDLVRAGQPVYLPTPSAHPAPAP